MFTDIVKSFIAFLTEESTDLPLTVHDISTSSIQQYVFKRYPSLFENHGAKAPYVELDFKN